MPATIPPAEPPQTEMHAHEASPYRSAQSTILRWLGGAMPGQGSGGRVETFLLALIFLNVVALVVETMPQLGAGPRAFLRVFEIFSVIVFTIEYVLRLWACTVVSTFAHPILGRLRFALTPLALVDLLAVLPFYLPMLGVDLRVMRAVRLMRILRILKLGRYSTAMTTLARVIRRKQEELVGTLLILLLLLVLASSLMYYAEHEAQPDRFTSIPASMWWGIITITTIGYGDLYPITPLGKAVAAVIAVLGIAMFALPTSILGSSFLEEAQGARNPPGRKTCPHCGKALDDEK